MFRGVFPKVAAGIVFACAVLLAACAPAAPGDDASSGTPSKRSGQLVGTSWVLERLGDQQVPDDAVRTAQFADSTVSGSSGCNNYSGEFKAAEETLEFGDLASTLMACDGDDGDGESAFLDALSKTQRYSVEEGTLTLLDAKDATLLVFSAQDNALVGTWIVTGYHDGLSGVASVLEDTEAEVSFDDEGNISGTGGCNRLMGTYTTEESALTVDPMAMTKMACPEPLGVMEQEAALLIALEKATTHEVEGDRLRLAMADGETAVTLSRA